MATRATRFQWLILFGFLTGCLSRPPLHVQTLAFESVAAPSAHGALGNQRVVCIRPLRVAAPFDNRSLIYRVGDFSYSADPYAEFLESPADSLRPPIRSWMRQSDLFQTVIEPGSALRPNTMAEITVLELYGDYRDPRNPAAVLTLQFAMLTAPEGIPEKLAFEKEYSRRILLTKRTPDALMSGWKDALNQILVQFGSDLRGLDSVPGS